MGQAVPVLGAIGKLDCGGTWAKYVCNDARLRSRCCEVCEFEAETHEIDVNESDSELEVAVDGCCHVKTH